MNFIPLLFLVIPIIASAPGFEPDQLIVSTPVGSLRIRNQLGTGRISKVYRAELEGQDAVFYAVKHSMSGRDELGREAEVLTALNTTAGFPRIYDYDSSDNFIVMELLSDFTSLDKFESNPRSIPIPVEKVAIGLLDRLEAVHSAGFVHVDVHTRNIMVNRGTGEVDLLDFSLAVRKNELKSPLYVNLYLSSVFEQARQPLHPIDDIERMVYVLIRCFYGELPWSSIMRMRERLDSKIRDGSDVINLVYALEKRILDHKYGFSSNDEYFDARSVHPGFRRVLLYLKDSIPLRESESFGIDYELLRSYFRDATSLPVDSAFVVDPVNGMTPSILPIAEDEKV
jgi:serine/threonine protein kinase